MDDTERAQIAVCLAHGAKAAAPLASAKLGIAIPTLALRPLNGLRVPVHGDACGWYIWGGETLSDDDAFYQPLHVMHLARRCPAIIKYLALPPGWRFLAAGGYEDVWFDPSLLT